ncbi:MAG: PAS domain S-box protein [Planctomycetes bacterium]|nr:PAS domain S-box protein [Planctomycetota bacterium]
MDDIKKEDLQSEIESLINSQSAVDEIRQLKEQLRQTEEKLSQCETYSAQVVKKLKKSRQEFVTIFDSVPAMIWYRNPEGKILKVNQCAADSVGRSIRDLVGKNYYELFPDGAERSRQQDREIIQSGQALRHQPRHFKAFDGSDHWALVDRIPLRNKKYGTISGVMVFAQNITKRKIAEDRLVRAKQEIEIANEQLKAAAERAKESADQAHRSNQAKSEILASSSHDLRTPMNSIIGFADILLQTELDDEQADYANTIHRSASGLLALINDILEFSKLEAGKMNIEAVACDLPEVIRDIQAMIEAGARRKGLDFIVQLDPRLPETIFTDPLRLKQCLINLLGNAVKFTEQGHVALCANLEQQGGCERIRFDVQDTGIGISLERQEAIFKSYSQEEISTARKFGGTGLGLTITKQLTELLGGHVNLSSQQGKGATFSITIPLLTQIEGAACRLSGLGKINRKEDTQQRYDRRILLAEENIPSQLTTNLLLRRTGLDVKTCSNAQELFEKIRKFKFDLILLNLSFEKNHGISVVHKLREQGVGIPIVVIDEYGEIRKNEALAAGCTCYLTKPLSRQRLYETVSEALQQNVCKKKVKALRSNSNALEGIAAGDETEPESDGLIDGIMNPEELTQMLPELVQELQRVLADADVKQAGEILKVISKVGQVWGNQDFRKKIDALQQSVLLKSEAAGKTKEMVDDLQQVCLQVYHSCQTDGSPEP